MKVMKGLMAVAVASLLLSGCAGMNEYLMPETGTDAGIGAVTGGILGAVLDSGEPWRGAILGAAAGTAAGWTGRETEANQTDFIIDANADIVNQAALDAARMNCSVRYSRTIENGVNEEIVAMPGSRTGNYRFVTIRYFRDGELILIETREVAV